MRNSINHYRTVTEKEVEAALRNTVDDALVVLVFTANWTGIGQILDDYYRALASTYNNHVRFLRIDIDRSKVLANNYNIRSVPTTIIYQSNEIVYRFEGALPKSIIVEKLNEYIN